MTSRVAVELRQDPASTRTNLSALGRLTTVTLRGLLRAEKVGRRSPLCVSLCVYKSIRAL